MYSSHYMFEGVINKLFPIPPSPQGKCTYGSTNVLSGNSWKLFSFVSWAYASSCSIGIIFKLLTNLLASGASP